MPSVSNTPGWYVKLCPMHGYSSEKEAILKRLSRIEGQVRGIARMVDEDRYCIDILTQLSAVQKAVDAVALQLLDDHVRHCVVGASASRQAERTEELMAAVGRLVRTR